jgi:hypothetical protein
MRDINKVVLECWREMDSKREEKRLKWEERKRYYEEEGINVRELRSTEYLRTVYRRPKFGRSHSADVQGKADTSAIWKNNKRKVKISTYERKTKRSI